MLYVRKSLSLFLVCINPSLQDGVLLLEVCGISIVLQTTPNREIFPGGDAVSIREFFRCMQSHILVRSGVTRRKSAGAASSLIPISCLMSLPVVAKSQRADLFLVSVPFGSLRFPSITPSVWARPFTPSPPALTFTFQSPVMLIHQPERRFFQRVKACFAEGPAAALLQAER